MTAICANAQNNAAMPVFDTYEHDFGTISEADGPVSHVFHLLNNSDKSVAISRADRKSTRLNSSHTDSSRMPSSA